MWLLIISNVFSGTLHRTSITLNVERYSHVDGFSLRTSPGFNSLAIFSDTNLQVSTLLLIWTAMETSEHFTTYAGTERILL